MEEIERAWRRPRPVEDAPAPGRKPWLIRAPVRWALAIAAAEGLMVATSIVCGDQAAWRGLLREVLAATLLIFVVRALFLWSLLRDWNRMEARLDRPEGLALGLGIAPAAVFSLAWTLLIVAITVSSVADALRYGFPQRG
ncbi:hypothetical protein ACO2Q3_11645 [Caulobacter sp. KR2-114]|uniref:hypothetical protein n=1 Tax=Caulobacter sp. KR2-114 TaxID=3400912 RepID=UPI003C0CBF8C